MPFYKFTCERPGPSGGVLPSWVTIEADNDDEAANHFFEQRKATPEWRDWQLVEIRLVRD